MLVLSRKKNESIVINKDITVTIVEIRGDKVRLGIVAPTIIPVHRQEIFEAIHGKPAPEPVALVPLLSPEQERVHADCPTCTCAPPKTSPDDS